MQLVVRYQLSVETKRPTLRSEDAEQAEAQQAHAEELGVKGVKGVKVAFRRHNNWRNRFWIRMRL